MSRARASVGFSPTRWKGARKMPNFIPRCAMMSPRQWAFLFVDARRFDEFSTDDEGPGRGRRGSRVRLTRRRAVHMIGRPTNKERCPEMPTMRTSVNGEPLSPESLRMLEYLRERAVALDPVAI